MNKINSILITTVISCLVYGCSGGGGGGGGGSATVGTPASIEGTYTATVTGIDVVRTADKHPVRITSLPANGAVVTVSP